MIKLLHLFVMLIVMASPVLASVDSFESTRITNPKQHLCSQDSRYPYRDKPDRVLKQLDLKPGDVVVDIGAGDGFWAEKMAPLVGSSGTIHASEVEQDKVDKLKERFTDLPRVKSYLSPFDSTALAENTCDMAFLSKTYHHLSEGTHVDYLKHLHQVVKPDGRLCVIEKHAALVDGRGSHAWSPALLLQQAEEAGWIIVRLQMITGTHHFIALFVQEEMFHPEPDIDLEKQTSLRSEDKMIEGMKNYFGESQDLIDHALAVYNYAEELQRAEGGDPLIVKTAALFHDIGIPEAQRIHGSSAGEFQEIEGPPIAKNIMQKLKIEPSVVDSVCDIIANHHTAHDESIVNTIEFQIIWDADGLVNHAGRNLGHNEAEIKNSIEKLFRTKTGRQIAAELFTKK